MASRYEAELTISSAKNLKNVNWRYGALRPYAVVWVEPNVKVTTRVDDSADDSDAFWDETLAIPFNAPIEDSVLHIDIVHAGSEPDTKPLIGSAKLPLRDLVDEAGGLGCRASRTLKLKRPSGRPQGKLDVRAAVRQPSYRHPDPYYPAPYGVPPPSSARDVYGAPPTAQPYGAPPTAQPYGAPPTAQPYGAPPTAQPYGGSQAGYGQPQSAYGQSAYGQPAYGVEKKKSGKFGMGTGLAVGAVGGLLGGLALAEGADYVEDKIADDVADRVEDDLGYDDDGGDF